MESFAYPHFSSTVHVALFNNVTNAARLRARIGDAEREAVNFAFVDARLVTSVLHIQTAVTQALLAASQNTLRTKTVHSEVLWALNPSNNITEALRRYGVSDDSTALLVIRIDPLDFLVVQDRMGSVVEGTLAPILELAGLTDWAAVKKYNKLNEDPVINEAQNDPSREHHLIDNIVVSIVAMKSVAA
ncbi:CGI-121-domain-containing protein [Multifurca ochricompacta]|uniref:EKC/KEOPS complex subunit CGI121 n=1 Tax=Multifurca ochricompacta TaxID=376703 RepID=A0AAD4M5A6_9AGAM|nr:CGI-121-domain-containing protein [Multifurca ochricompacta]